MCLLALPSLDATPMPTQSLLVKVGRQFKAVPALVRSLTNHPAIDEAYLSYAGSLGNGNVAEMLIRLAIDLTKQSALGALSVYEASKKEHVQSPEITGQAA